MVCDQSRVSISFCRSSNPTSLGLKLAAKVSVLIWQLLTRDLRGTMICRAPIVSDRPRHAFPLKGTLSNEDGNANDDGSEKSLFFVKVIRVLFLCYKFCE